MNSTARDQGPRVAVDAGHEVVDHGACRHARVAIAPATSEKLVLKDSSVDRPPLTKRPKQWDYLSPSPARGILGRAVRLTMDSSGFSLPARRPMV